ncbi:MAG: hypothetical protein RIR16_883 [Actinomycetota bacterium]|jgi:methylenetetrahydrofolate reductase (NADPH)
MTSALFRTDNPTLSFEFFPPKDAGGDAALWESFDALLEAKPNFVSVTYGAGGSNQGRSLEILKKMASAVPTIGHLTCVGASFEKAKRTISDFQAANVSAILALRGDAPVDNPDALQQGEIKTALELVELIRTESELEIGVAAFPEKHPESPTLEHDAGVLALKQNSGASFAMTQLFFSVAAYQKFLELNRKAGVTIPVVPGVMPIANAKQVLRMAAMSGAEVPERLRAELMAVEADPVAARKIGMDFTISLANQLLDLGVPGLHIFSLNHHAAALEVARGAGLVS